MSVELMMGERWVEKRRVRRSRAGRVNRLMLGLCCLADDDRGEVDGCRE